jgi:NADPH:quinone reductase-like Zn-dependent oxidoreductase
MKAAIYHEFGGPEVLRYEDVPDPVPGPGEVVVKVHSVTVNRVLNCAVRAGTQQQRGVKPPHVGGVDPAGVVTALGDGVDGPAVGTRVAVLSRVPCLKCEDCAAGNFNDCKKSCMLGIGCWGGDADYVKVPASIVVPIPDNLDFAEAAAVLRHGPMAYHLLFGVGKLQPGQSVLIMGAAGGLGSTGIQLAKQAGATVITTAGSDERLAIGMDLGADFGVNYNKDDLTKAVRDYTNGEGVHLVYENISSPDTWPKALACLRKFGRLVTAGAHGGGTVDLDCAFLYHQQLRIIGSTASTDEDVRMTIETAAAGKLKAKVEKIFPLSEAPEAHRLMESTIPTGKIVLDPTLG